MSVNEREQRAGDLFAAAGTPDPSVPHRPGLQRKHLRDSANVDGRSVPDRLVTRLRALGQRLLTSAGEREEAEVDALLLDRRTVTRTNLVSVVSPKGGVGKTTCTYLIGDLLSSRLQLRALAIDTNPDFGTLGKLADDSRRSEYQLSDVMGQMDRIHSAAELDPYVSTTRSGLHLLAAPQHPEVMEQMSPKTYGQLLAFLGRFYHVILLDLGTGLTEPLARFALEQADQAVLVNTADWITSSTVVESLGYVLDKLGGHQVTMAINKSRRSDGAMGASLQRELRSHQLARQVVIPDNDRLRSMLDQGTYTCEQLDRETRVAIKRLALSVADQLV